jgi:Icc protein
MQILHLTDPHLYGSANARLRGVETHSSLHAVLDDAFSDGADYAAVLVTGDLVQDDPTGYRQFSEIFRGLGKPVLCIPGNHDEPEAMRRELAGAPFQLCGTHQFDHWQFIMLDSYDPGHVGGRLTEQELSRLDAALRASPRHAMVCLHHHPINMGSRWLDTVGLAEPDAFWRIVDSHPHVRAVVWGHVHQEYESRRGGVRLFATPSTGAQFLPNSERYAVDSRPPGYRHFDLHADGRIETAVHWVEAQLMRKAAAR